MNSTISYIEANAVCSIILAMIFFNEYRINDRADYRILFSQYLLVAILNMVVDALWVLIDRNVILKTDLSYGLISLAYLFAMEFAAYLWLLYSYAFTKSDRLRSPKSRRLAALPIALACSLLVVSYLTGHGVYVDADGSLHNPIVYFISIAPYLAYLGLASEKCIREARKNRYGAERFQYYTMALFPAFMLFSNLIQLVNLDLPTIGYDTTIACLFIYMVFLQNMISIDALTQMNNRNQLNRFMSNLESGSDKDQKVCMMMVDADKFKEINDTYGHASGDDALRAISAGLKATCGSMSDLRPFIARYGGDEFFVALRTRDEEAVRTFADRVHTEIDAVCTKMGLPFRVKVSIGWAFLKPGESDTDCIARADEALYQAKRASHRNR